MKMGRCVCGKEQRMNECQNCGRGFEPNRFWQKFCCKQCQQKWNKDQYRADRVEEERETRMNGHGTPEERREATGEARMVIERMMAGPRIVRRI
jgi:hypothetical protein